MQWNVSYSQLSILCDALTFYTECDVLFNHTISLNSDSLVSAYLNQSDNVKYLNIYSSLVDSNLTIHNSILNLNDLLLKVVEI